MADGFWVVALLIAAVIVYVVAQVIFYSRKSRQQWREVDRSKLRKWEDEDEW
jgi:beta-lactamase regulating signal transducer with metallopeptidase domain